MRQRRRHEENPNGRPRHRTTAFRLHVLPEATHYAVYSTERPVVIKMAVDWFDRYLKAK